LKVIIVIISFNFNAFLRKSLDNIKALLKDGTYRTVVVDNGSTDGSAEYLASRDDILFIKNETNRGFGPACNQGVKATEDTEFEDADVFLLNNDALITTQTLPYLERTLYSAEDIGAVGCVSNSAGNRQQLDIQFGTVDEYLQFGNEIDSGQELELQERVRLSGFAMLIRRELWNDIGGFDEDFVPGYFEDDALSMEIARRGYRMMLVGNSFVYHAGSMSFEKVDQSSIVKRNAALFIDKYGFNIVDYAYGDEVLALTLPFEREKEFSVLQYRSGLGADLKVIKDSFPNCRVFGVEDRKELRSISENTENVFDSLAAVMKAMEEAKEFAPVEGFDALVIDSEDIQLLSQNGKETLEALCKANAMLMQTHHKYVYYPFDEVKMVQWDLDVLSERKAYGEFKNEEAGVSSFVIDTIRMLAKHGIVNSISSYFDKDKAQEILEKSGILDKFVFVDAVFSEREVLRITDPQMVLYVYRYFEKLVGRDIEEKNLQKMKILESKLRDRHKAASEETFLKDSDIHITIKHNCMDLADDIEGIILTSDKLNFTRRVEGKKQLIRLLSDDWNEAAYICARDKYCDYGVVGFYCINHWDGQVKHFVFSDDIFGMGIEEYVYKKLEAPELDSLFLKKYESIDWIIEDNVDIDNKKTDRRLKILIRGGRNLAAVADYLDGARVTREFYNERKLSDEKLLSGDYSVVVFSLLTKETGDHGEIFDRLDYIYDMLEGKSEIILLLDSLDKKYLDDYVNDHPGISLIGIDDLELSDDTSYYIAGKIAEIINGC
jgi:GT2 family glycosyltransferase